MVVAFLPGFFDHASAKLLAKQDLNGIPVAVNDECHQIEDLVSDIISVHLFLAEISERLDEQCLSETERCFVQDQREDPLQDRTHKAE